MARKPMVTRTIQTTKVNVMCLNITKAEPFTTEVTLPRTYSDPNKLLKAVKELVETEEVKAVHVVSTQTVETLYGMTEQDFISNAIILDNATRKPIETESEAETESE